MPERPPRACDKKPKPPRRRGTAVHYGRDWQRFRKVYLDAHPVCIDPWCRHTGRVVPADHVDHIKPIEDGGERLDWDNVRSLCHSCHSYRHASGL